MLRRGNLSIKEISTTCGYQDPNYFTRLFKSITGMTPREYISRNKEEVQDA
jgi:two-component system response regulator YesN